VNSFAATLVNWAHRRRGALLLVVLGVTLASIAGIRRLSFDTDVLSLLPRDARVLESFRTFLARFGSLDQLYVVFTAPEGHTVSDYSDEVDAFVERLRAAPEIERVDTGLVDRSRDFSWLADRQLLLLGGASLDEALRRLRPAGMQRAVADRRELLAVPSADIAAMVRQDPLGLLDLLRNALGGPQSGLHLGVAEGGYVTADGHGRLVIARPRRPPYDAAFSRALDARLREIVAAVHRAPPADARNSDDDETLPPLQVEFAGGHRIAVETEAVVRSEAIMNTVGSLALILPLLYVAFRSLWLVAVGSLPSALSLVIVLGALGWANQQLSAAAAGSAAMLFGLGVDGVVLLYVAHRHALAENAPDPVAAIAGPSASMLLGMWTTAATFYGLLFVNFPSLQQLGALIGHSMVVCGILTLVMVPALLPRRRPTRIRALLMPRLAQWIDRSRWWVLGGGALITVLLGVAATHLRVNPTLERLRSVTDAARLEAKIGDAFGLPRDVYIVLAEGPQLQELLETNERLADRLTHGIPGLAFQPPTRLLPSFAAQTRTAAQIAAAHISAPDAGAALERAGAAAGFKPGSFDPFEARLPRLLDPAIRLDYDGYAAHDLADLVQRFVVHDGDRWMLATYAFPANPEQAARLQSIVDEVDRTQTLTGLSLVNQELARRFLPQFTRGLTIGSGIVVLLVILAFRDWWLSLLALLPTAIGLVWGAGILAITGVELDLFAVFAVVTFVGIGVDYGVHLVHRHQERGDAVQATAELAPVILVAAAITLLGYGTLVTSTYPPLRAMGLVSVVSTVTLAAASVLVLPALLVARRRR
jgi:predicted RND superfamily exporter protein